MTKPFISQRLGPKHWGVSLLPGMALIGGVILVRLLGLLQNLEWAALDYGLKLRLPEPVDERIVIVGINEGDIQALQSYPISDRDLADLLEQLQAYRPQVIGVDIFRDLPVEPGHTELSKVFKNNSNIIAIERILPGRSGFTVSAPPNLPDEQVGFVDAVLDADGFLRRSLLGASNLQGKFRFSFTMRIAETYLQDQGIFLTNGILDPEAMRFRAKELHRFQPHTGGYIRADAAGNQILLNFRSGPRPFRQVSLRDIQTRSVNPEWLRDRIVLIGVTALSQKDLINTAAISGMTPGLVYGVEVQAHAISQIISTVLDNRPLLTTWPDVWEYIWIILWGSVGLVLGRLSPSPTKHFSVIIILGIALIGFSYGCLLLGLWIPLVPALIAFGLNSIALYAFHLYDQGLKARIQDRQMVIEKTFDALHNGPLQTLSALLRQTQDQDGSMLQLNQNLQTLNQELRVVYEDVRQELQDQDRQFTLGRDLRLDLKSPLHEILYEVYAYTVQRNFPCFQTLKVKVVTFEPLDSRRLNFENKRDLCRFLEETLCNVGKHAEGVTRLTIVCGQSKNLNFIRVEDNGISHSTIPSDPNSTHQKGRGTQQALTLAQHLQGSFQRYSSAANGTICEIIWPIQKPWFWQR